MLGLSFEKLLAVAFIAALVIGPHRLPSYASRLADLVRRLRALLDDGRTRMEAELGVPLGATDWRTDLRKYDPRTIIRDALSEPGGAEPTVAAASAAEHVEPAPASPVEPAPERRWAVTGGSSGHPRRTLVGAAGSEPGDAAAHRPATNASSAS